MIKFDHSHTYRNFSFRAKSSTIFCTKFCALLNRKTEKAVRVNKHCRKRKISKLVTNHQILVKVFVDIESYVSNLVLTYKLNTRCSNLRPNIDVILTGEFVLSCGKFEFSN